MVDEHRNPARRALPFLGFRRIEFVDVVVDEQGARASVTGVAHRLPHTIRVSLRTARELIEAGVPSRIDGLPRRSSAPNMSDFCTNVVQTSDHNQRERPFRRRRSPT